MLTLQRLGGGKSLAAIVKDVITYNQDFLPDNKRVREGTISERSGAYSRARKRLPLEMVQQFAGQVSESLVDQSPSWFGDQRAYIIDGTTMTLSPTSSLRDAYPPATNQFGETVWPVMMLMVAHSMVGTGHDLLFRLTKSRFKSMRRSAELVGKTEHSVCYRLTWKPSSKERKSNPDLPDDASLEANLHGRAPQGGTR